MVKIISHNGYWKNPHTLEGIEQVKKLGVWGIEEDIFERNGIIYLGEEDNGTNPLLIDALKIIDRQFFIDNTEGKVDIELLDKTIGNNEHAIVLTANPDELKSEHPVAWNTFTVQPERTDFYHITPKIKYYVLNPAWDITKQHVADIEATGAKIIPVCLSYNNKETDRMLYWHSLLRGLEYIMVDYVEDFKKFCEEYEIYN